MDEEGGLDMKRILSEGAFIINDKNPKPRLVCGCCGGNVVGNSASVLSEQQVMIVCLACSECGALYYLTAEVRHGE